jgi:predicted transposase/invertase (TIGR01784 family)
MMTLQEKYINPFTDFGFKKLFGTELNKDLLIDFLNEVILPENRKVLDLNYTNTEKAGKTEFERKAIFDIYCTGQNGEHFIVEMQKAKQDYFKDRSVFYASFPIQEQAQKGNWNFKLSEIYTVGILDFVFSEDKDKKIVRHEVKLKDQNCKVFYDKLTFIYLEMPNFLKTEEELETTYDKWLYVLKHLPELQKRPKKLQEKIFDKLFKAAEIAKFTKEEMRAYEDSLKIYRDLQNVIDTARTESREEGRMEGRIEEKTAGIINALKMGMFNVEVIAQLFRESIENVLKIKKENNL